jgi:pullulanase
MGLHDIETMNIIRWELDRIDPSIIMYGEGWAAGASPLEEKRRALKANGPLLNERIALFSDDIRDGIKGSVMDEKAAGFVNLLDDNNNDEWTMIEDIKFGICGAVEHPQVDITKVHYSKEFWAKEPSQCINYASSHDDHSLWDKLVLSCSGADDETLCKMNKLSAAIVLTSQGIPFFQAGEELARSKGGVKNSYRSPDEVNNINWDNKKRYFDLYEYYRGLILLRKTFPAFRLGSAEEIRRRLEFIDLAMAEKGIIAYTINGENLDDGPHHRFLVIFNGSSAEKEFALPPGTWIILADHNRAGITPLGSAEGQIKLDCKSAFIAGKKERP